MLSKFNFKISHLPAPVCVYEDLTNVTHIPYRHVNDFIQHMFRIGTLRMDDKVGRTE